MSKDRQFHFVKGLITDGEQTFTISEFWSMLICHKYINDILHRSRSVKLALKQPSLYRQEMYLDDPEWKEISKHLNIIAEIWRKYEGGK